MRDIVCMAVRARRAGAEREKMTHELLQHLEIVSDIPKPNSISPNRMLKPKEDTHELLQHLEIVERLF